MSIHLMGILLHKTKRKRKRFQVALACLLCIQQNTPFLSFILQSPLMLYPIFSSRPLWYLSIKAALSSTASFISNNSKDNCITPNSTKKLSYNFFCHTNKYFNVTLTKLVHNLKIDMTSPFTLPKNVTEKLNPKPLHI